MPLEFELCPGRKIGGSNPCFIIAEIGQNHQGDVEIAKKMIRMAKSCGADCVKFQKTELEHRFTKRALARPYTSQHSWGSTYGDHKRHLEFSHEQYRELQRFAQEVGIFFTASGMDEVSEGRARAGLDCHRQSNKKKMLLLLLLMMIKKSCLSVQEYQKEFPDIPIGYSGHESGISVSVAAVALGAKVLERHVSLDKSWKGSDHAASLEPAELEALVREIRIVEMAMGSPVKQMLPCEASFRKKLGKSVVAKKAMKKGTELTQDMLGVKVAEPEGIAPENIWMVVGKKITVDVEEDDTITNDMIQD
ncbi:sialic acid synthase-like [Neoarius graeffei]|uniref:sialic acid synthase-like n=1 Tax=Neoarius graeffei TaxID=443677 RepID=UPI00298C8AB7|nr:sialic acid synthase-like [Neoarius graeffei]